MKTFIEKWESLLEWGGIKKDILFLSLAGISLLCSIFANEYIPFEMAWVAIILCGIPIISEAIIGLITAFDIKADVLVSLALIASVWIGEYFAAGEVAFIMQLGALLEDVTVSRARAGIEKLVDMTPQTAHKIGYLEYDKYARLKNSNLDNKEFWLKWKENCNGEENISAQAVRKGDILRVLPGETIPVDGEILMGQTAVDQSVMTGESIPVDKKAGDKVSSGTVNQFGTFEMIADRAGEDSSIQRMIRLVESADADKAKIVSLADQWATWIVVIALTAAALTGILTGEIIRAVTILVVFCPCSLVLATPTAIMAAIGNATKHGFLVKEGDALERLAKVTKVTFDKTGTLTIGRPRVIAIESLLPDYSEQQIFALAAAVEQYSEHPLGKAVVSCFKETEQEKALELIEGFEMLPGKGVVGYVENQRILAGNKTLFDSYNVQIAPETESKIKDYVDNGCSMIYIAVGNKMAGLLVLSDMLRRDAKKTVSAIKNTGIQPVLLTGDLKNTAEKIAKEAEIENIHAECLPEGKLQVIQQYQSEGNKICMIGDGINDAPALKMSYVGIAMGGVGSDIAVDAADIVLVNDEIKELPHLFALSKKMMTTIKYNLIFSMILNFVAIFLAITGILNPVVGALVHNCGSVLVIINSALLLRWKN